MEYSILEKLKKHKYIQKTLKVINSISSSVKEQEDDMICYIDDIKKLKRISDDKYRLLFTLPGFYYDEQDKHVCYVFENIEFKQDLHLYSDHNTSVVFQNCKFHKQIHITNFLSASFQGNNEYYDEINIYYGPSQFLTITDTDEVIFCNENIQNLETNIFLTHQPCFSMKIDAGTVCFENTKVCLGDNFMDISANEIISIHSQLDAAHMTLDAYVIKKKSYKKQLS